MAWQAEVGSGTDRATDYRDYLTKLVAMMTSQHVATVVINNGGTGGTYVIGDVVTLTHGSAFLDARFEVLTVAAGQILTMRIISSGAFALRLASAVVNAGGSGYQVGDILEVQGGTEREQAKAQVATLSGSAVATVALFETGGAYTAAPGLTGAATVGVGSADPQTFAGDDACTLDLTMQALVGTTALAVTGGGGSGATVDITLAQTGWTVDDRNTNNLTHNSLTDEKEVTLVADATGFTNKPYAHFFTGSEVDGLDDRFFMQAMMSVAHNPALAISAQPGLSPGRLGSSGGYLLFPQNTANDSDFWIQVDDLHVFSETNANPTANTDDGQYFQMYAGFFDRLKTETEDPFPAFIFASSRSRDANPATAADTITSMAELRTSGTGPGYYYRSEGSAWTEVKNNSASSPGTKTDVMFPFGEIPEQNDGGDPETVVAAGPIPLNDTTIKRDRSASTRLLLPMPGSVDDYPLYELAIVRKLASDVSEVTDSVRGQLRGIFWLYNTDAAGVAINNFSEDFITIGTDRYRIFQNHTLNDRYQYMAVKETV